MSRNVIKINWKDTIYFSGFSLVNSNILKENEGLNYLNSIEKVYYQTLKFDYQKRSYLLGRIAAKKAIGEIICEVHLHDILIDRGVFDFPVVKGVLFQNIQVSISHCDFIGVAISFPEDHPMGVDLEKVDVGKMAGMKSAMTMIELTQASKIEMKLSQYFTLIWTMKEGLSKVLRTGLTLDFKLLEVEHLSKIENLYIAAFKNFGQYKAIAYCAGDYVCAVVLPKNSDAALDRFFGGVEDLVNG